MNLAQTAIISPAVTPVAGTPIPLWLEHLPDVLPVSPGRCGNDG